MVATEEATNKRQRNPKKQMKPNQDDNARSKEKGTR